ncbi:hypothetical protein FQA39_LY10223 [Lamprigera yunnana]|nr:hypothetical protein FQA39_LY10223 [Lamprigera yunnana]
MSGKKGNLNERDIEDYLTSGVTAFLIFSSGVLTNLKSCFQCKHPPIMMLDGNVLNSKEALEMQLEVLEKQLLEKANELESSKLKVDDTKENIEKPADTQVQAKNYYCKLKREIVKSEEEFSKLQSQIDDYRYRRIELEQEMKRNEEYYTNL